MAVGRLGSLKTVSSEVNTNLELYTSAHTSSNVTINVTNQGVEDANFAVGLSSLGLNNITDLDYIISGQIIKPKEFISIENVGISSGNTIFCRASKSNISFAAFSVFDYLGFDLNFGRENSLKTDYTTNPINKDLLLLTVEKDSNITVNVNNRSVKNSTFFIGISSGTINEFSVSDYLIFGKPINKNKFFTLSNLVLSANQSIIVKASTPDVTFSAFSLPIGINTVAYASTAGAAGSLYGTPNIDVDIVTSNQINSDNIYSVGIITTTSFSSSTINVVGVVTANSFIKSGGTSNSFLKADGSTDTNTYLTAAAVGGSTDNIGGQIVVRSGTGAFSAGIITATLVNGNVTGNVTGNVNSSGVSTFSGGIIGSLTGTATTAQGLSGTPNIVVGIVTCGSINVSGIITAATLKVESIQDLNGNVIITSTNLGKSSGNPATSATAIKLANPATTDGLYWISMGGSPRQVFCSFDSSGQGWILAMRMNYGSTTLGYNSAYWTDTSVLNSTSLATDELDIKTYAFNDFTIQAFRMCASRNNTAYDSNKLDFPNGGSGFSSLTLRAIFNSGNNVYNSEVNLGRTGWLNWFEASTGTNRNVFDNQPNCNDDRINAAYGVAARIGISMNNEGDCNSNDSGIGFGLAGAGNAETGSGGTSWSPTIRYPSYGWLWIR